MKTYVCQKCGFITKENHKTCPLCAGTMEKTESEINHNFNYALPRRFTEDDRNVRFGFYCYKCKKISPNEVCLHCNIKSYLALTFNDKTVVLNYLDSLSEEFSDEEITEILRELSFEEKNYIYHNLAISYKLLYRRDKAKAIVCILMALVMMYLGLEVAFNNQDKAIISYFAFAFGSGCFVLFLLLGITYFYDAAIVEYSHFAKIVGIITVVIELIYIVTAVAIAFSFQQTVLFGVVALMLALIINFSYYFIGRKL